MSLASLDSKLQRDTQTFGKGVVCESPGQVVMGQNSSARGLQVLVHVSTYQGSILGTYF